MGEHSKKSLCFVAMVCVYFYNNYLAFDKFSIDSISSVRNIVLIRITEPETFSFACL